MDIDSVDNLLKDEVDTDDDDDPLYIPKEERPKSKKTVPDYYNDIKLEQNSSDKQQLSPTISSASEYASVPASSSELCCDSIREKAAKYSYLDGKFFKIFDFNESEKKVTAECQLCLPKSVKIKGHFGISTNFLKHLKSSHHQTNSLDEYNKYKIKKKLARSEHTTVSAPSSQLSRIGIREKAAKYSYLDGKFFKIFDFNESKNRVTAECQLCLPRSVKIKGHFGISTNFLKHLKSSHHQTNSIDEYNRYKIKQKQARSEFTSVSASSSELFCDSIREKAAKLPYLDGKFFKIFDFNESENRVTAECQLCLPKSVKIKGHFGISTNFLKHLKNSHHQTNSLDEYNKYKTKKKLDETQSENTVVTLQTSKEYQDQQKITEKFQQKGIIEQKDFDKRIIKFITSTISAVTFIEEQSFIDLFQGFNIKIMSQSTAMRKIEEICNEMLVKLKKELEDIEYVCTTVNIWSAKRLSFFGLTCHWIDKNLKRRSAALACHRFSGIHNFAKIAEIIDDIHKKLNLSYEKVVSTVTDNGSDFVKAFKEFGVLLPENEDDNEDEAEAENNFEEIYSQLTLPKHVKYASHTLILIATTDVKNAIAINPKLRTKHINAIAKCNDLWKLASQTKTAEKIQIIFGHALSHPEATRWNSLFDSISQILDHKDVLPSIFERLEIKRESFNESDLTYLSEYCLISKPFASALEILQGGNTTFYGYVLPCIGSLLKKIEKLKSEKSCFSKPILDMCKNSILKRFKKLLDISTEETKEAIIATFTLPKFKLKWLSSFTDIFITDENLVDVVSKVVLETAVNLYGINSVETAVIPSDTTNLSKEDEFFELDEEKTYTNQSYITLHNNIKTKIKLEILQYSTDPRIELDTLNSYPTIKKLFYKFNTPLSSSAAVERLLSFTEILNAPKRNALSDQNFENILLLKANEEILDYTFNE